MLSVEECKEHLGDVNLSDEQVEGFRDALYALVENLLDEYINNAVSITPTCKNLSSTVGFPPTDRKVKVTD